MSALVDGLLQALNLKTKPTEVSNSTETTNTSTKPPSIKCHRCKCHVPFADFIARTQTCVTYNCFLKKDNARMQVADKLNISPDDLIPIKAGKIAPYSEAFGHKPLGHDFVD